MRQIPLRYLIVTLAVLLLLGFGLMTIGLVYDISFAGMPPQDSSPKAAAEFAAQSGRADIFYIVGAVFSALGSLVALAAAGVAIYRILSS